MNVGAVCQSVNRHKMSWHRKFLWICLWYFSYTT